MEKNKIPIWENKKDYPADLDFIVDHLLAISDRDYQLRVWYRADGPEVDWYEECVLSFENGISYLETLLRKGKTSLDPLQVKAILRVYAMTNHFYKILYDEKLPEDWCEEQLYIINHPYWQKIQRQAAYALSLLRNDENIGKPLRTYGSIKTRTASRYPKLDDRFGEKMKVFSDHFIRERQWKDLDEFWNSVKDFYVVFDKFFDGNGMLANGRLFNRLMAFHNELDPFCEQYAARPDATLKQIISDPRLIKIEQKARDFLELLVAKSH